MLNSGQKYCYHNTLESLYKQDTSNKKDSNR